VLWLYDFHSLCNNCDTCINTFFRDSRISRNQSDHILDSIGIAIAVMSESDGERTLEIGKRLPKLLGKINILFS